MPFAGTFASKRAADVPIPPAAGAAGGIEVMVQGYGWFGEAGGTACADTLNGVAVLRVTSL
jgi:hypothetical protein